MKSIRLFVIMPCTIMLFKQKILKRGSLRGIIIKIQIGALNIPLLFLRVAMIKLFNLEISNLRIAVFVNDTLVVKITNTVNVH